MINALIEAFVRVFRWKVVKETIVSTNNSISYDEAIQAQVKELPEDDPLVYQEQDEWGQPDLAKTFEFWAKDNKISASMVEMAKGDFWNDESEKASIEHEIAVKARDEEVQKHMENQG